MSKFELLSKSSAKLSFITERTKQTLIVLSAFYSIHILMKNKTEKIFFAPIINSYSSLAKEMGINNPEQIREWDIGAKTPTHPQSKKKILQILRKKRTALDQVIQDYEALYGY